VLETTGRRSGRTYRTPLLASRAPGGYLWVSTVLGRHANWLRNARANPGVRYWVKGRLHEGQAIVAAPGMAAPALDALPQSLRWLAKRGIDASLLLGFGVLIIIPSHPAP
jgi:deazaflavin-dependent oxidoreductase (nitroreductase family)